MPFREREVWIKKAPEPGMDASIREIWLRKVVPEYLNPVESRADVKSAQAPRAKPTAAASAAATQPQPVVPRLEDRKSVV